MTAWNDPWVWQVRDLGGPFRATQLLETARRHMDRELVVDLSDVRQVYANGAVPFAAVLAFLRGTTDQRITVRMPSSVDFDCSSQAIQAVALVRPTFACCTLLKRELDRSGGVE